MVGGELSNDQHAVVWQGTHIIDLGSAGTASHAWAINDLNQVAGQSFKLGEGGAIDGYVNAMLWTTSGAVNLGATLNRADTYSWGLAINNLGQVLGSASAYDPWGRFHTRAILWDEGRAIDLNDFMDAGSAQEGWVFTSAVGGNDLGDILVTAAKGNLHKAVVLTVADRGYVVHDFLAVGVPEPSTYATMLMGLGALGWALRRRRQAV